MQNSLAKPSFLQRLKKSNYLLVFLLGFVTALLFFLPFLIYDNGLFIYYGDYNVQQIPFYQNVHDAIQSGSFAWNWTTDLGVNTIGSYSFYMLTSPFFWMTLPFPSEAVPYLMAPLLMVKFGLMAVTGYAFIRRFVKHNTAAVAGGLLYAFCGFNIYNIFFNHFHEAVIVFPLMLIALEEFVINKRRGMFALSVCLGAVINYYFFFGQALFLILYFFVRMASSKDFRLSLKEFFLLLAEAVLGVLLSMFIFLPSALAAFGNSRVSNILLGYDLVVYNEPQRYGQILESFFFPPEIPARNILFTDAGAKWSSLSMFLPAFSATGVIAYFLSVKKSFIKRILAISFVIALIPGLNALFSLLNYNYYARWFYMPILLMALATVISLEKYADKLKPAAIITAVCVAGFSLIGLLPKKIDDEIVFFSLIEDLPRFFAGLFLAVAALLVTIFIYHIRIDKKIMLNTSVLMICVFSVIMGVVTITSGKAADSYYASYDMVHNRALNGGDFTIIDDIDNGFYRIDTYNELDNLGMFWGMPTINAFHSIVPASTMEFYDAIGVDRGVASRPLPNKKGLRSLLSVKYRICAEGTTESELTEGYEYIGTENGYDIYENPSFVGMGFTYDSVVSRSLIDSLSHNGKEDAMLSYICLEDADYEKYAGLFTSHLTDEYYVTKNNEEFAEACNKLNANTVDSFSYTNSSFTATAELEKENLVFFSVPYDSGWSVTVNGKEADVIKANIGFMAVYCPAGENVIEFTYKTPGLLAGITVTSVFAVIFTAYILLVYYLRKKGKISPLKKHSHLYSTASDADISAHTAYIDSITADTVDADATDFYEN